MQYQYQCIIQAQTPGFIFHRQTHLYHLWLCGLSPSPSGQGGASTRHLLHVCTNANGNKTKPNHVRPKRSGSVESLIRHLLPRWIAREDPPPHTSYPHSSKPLNFSPLFSIFLILHFSTKNFKTFRLFQHFSCFLTFSYFYHFTYEVVWSMKCEWINYIKVKYK